MPINVDVCDALYLDINQESDLRRHTINNNKKFCYFQFNKNFNNHKKYYIKCYQIYQYQENLMHFLCFDFLR